MTIWRRRRRVPDTGTDARSLRNDYDGGMCPCGGAWFELVPRDEDEGTVMAFCVTREGEVSGWTGQMACVECGRIWEPGRHLQVVEEPI